MYHTLAIGFSLIILLSSCGIGGDLLLNNGICDGYTSSGSSQYVLPYQVGESYKVSQGNCGGITHYGKLRYGYDFDMSVGVTIVSIRGGTVHRVLDEANNPCLGNAVMIDHGDGTYARYLHLSSISVTEGSTINQGDTLGLSGSSGCTNGFPHLHLDVTTGSDPNIIDTIPITFNNAGSNTRGLFEGKTYLAE